MERTVDARLTRIETIVEELHHSLLGNGQPGEIREINSRLSALERFKYTLMGGTGAFSGLVGAFFAWFFHKIGS